MRRKKRAHHMIKKVAPKDGLKPVLIDHDREKLLNAVVYFVKGTKHCGVTKLVKLLYYLDFFHFKEAGRSVTSLTYYAWQFGPVPKAFYKELNSTPQPDDLAEFVRVTPKADPDDFTVITPVRKFDGKWFSKRELRLLHDVADMFKNARAKDMVEVAHLPNTPWDATVKTKGMLKEIDYLLALDDSEESLKREEVMERLADRKVIRQAFGEVRHCPIP